MRVIKKFIHIILIILLGSLVYSNSLTNQFIWDDQYLVEENTYIKNWRYLPQIFTKDIGEGSGVKYGFYRPLQILSYKLDYSLWRLNPKGYHLSNIILHILVGILIYWLANVLFKEKTLSFIASLLFITHPLHTETVTYISGRQESLAFFFVLASFLSYIKYLRNKNIGYFALTIMGYIGSLLSKEVCLVFPLLILLYHSSFKERLNLKMFISLVIVSLLYLLLRITFLKDFLFLKVLFPISIFPRTLAFFAAICNYLKILIFPLNIYPEYGNPLFKITDIEVLTGIGLIITLLIYILKKRNRNPLLSFSIGWFFIVLLPVSGLIYPLSTYMRPHWLHIPSLGFFFILGKIFANLIKREKFKFISSLLLIGLLLLYSYLTFKQNTLWGEPLTFYKKNLKYLPQNSNLYTNLGNAYMKIGNKKEAIKMFKKAVKLDSKNAVAYNNLGVSYSKIGKSLEAITFYKKAIEAKPTYIKAYSNLGVEYAKVGKTKEAIRIFKKAIKMNPYYPDAYFNLAATYQNLNNFKEAILLYTKTIQIEPSYSGAYFNLALLLSQIGKKEEAITLLEKAKKLSPKDPEIYYNLAVIYKNLGRKKESLTYSKKAKELSSRLNQEKN